MANIQQPTVFSASAKTECCPGDPVARALAKILATINANGTGPGPGALLTEEGILRVTEEGPARVIE